MTSTPPCPICRSPITERLPFGKELDDYPVYSCGVCGHVWRQPKVSSQPDTSD